MRILVVGDWHSELHEEAVYQSFIELGHDVYRFSWHQYFLVGGAGILSKLYSPWKKAQNKYLFGPLLYKINMDLLQYVKEVQPEFIFVYRGTHIFPSTLKKIKKIFPNCILASYNNDDPFSEYYTGALWRYFLQGISLYDVAFAYRKHNLEDYKKYGVSKVALLRSWYIKEMNYPVDLSEDELKRYGCDVVFVGHYEDDGRLEMLESIVERGYTLKVFGPPDGWNKKINNSSPLSFLSPVFPVWGEEYNKAICGAKIALCFLSKLNRDTYTRRCFEIPACKTMMLSEYSDDLSTLFVADQEAVFFRNKEEMLVRLGYYLKNDMLRKKIAAAGYNRVKKDGHDVGTRAKDVIRLVEAMRCPEQGMLL